MGSVTRTALLLRPAAQNNEVVNRITPGIYGMQCQTYKPDRYDTQSVRQLDVMLIFIDRDN